MQHLLTFLGTNAYQPCTYYRDDFAHTSAYSILAMASYIRHRHPECPLRCSVLTTPTAHQRNAQALLENWPDELPTPTLIDIPETAGEAEYWQLFQILQSTLQTNETLWLDVTHSFRYLPLLAFAVLQYQQVVAAYTVGGILYGAAEVLGPVTQWPAAATQRRVPLHDLTPFLTIQQWTLALRDFQQHGSAEALARLTYARSLPLRQATRGQDPQSRALNDLGKALQDWHQDTVTCRSQLIRQSDLGPQIARCIQAIGTDMAPPLTPLFAKLAATFAPVQRGRLSNLFFAARWSAQHQRMQQAHTLLQESLITYFHERWRQDLSPIFSELRDQRKFVSQLLNQTAEQTPPERWTYELGANKALGQRLQADISPGVARAYAQLTGLRNDLNHAGTDKNASQPKKFKTTFEDICNSLQQEGIL